MKRYIFEVESKVYELYNLRDVKKQSFELAKKLNTEVCITLLHNNGKQTWYTMLPDGRLLVDGKNLSFNN